MAGNGKIPVDAREQLSPLWRRAGYFASVLGVAAVMATGMALNSSPNPRLFYLVALSAICFSPLLGLQRLNGRYFLLGVYMAVHFQYFGIGDLMSTLVGRAATPDESLLTWSEMIILVSLASALAGYLAVAFRPAAARDRAAKDWPLATALLIGLVFWAFGTACLTYWQTFVITDRTNASLLKNISALGPALTTVFMAGQLIQPLGIMILAYIYAAYRRTWLLPLILVVVLVQMVLGFIADFKSEAMLAGLLVVAAKTYIDGKIPKAWLLGAGLFVVFVFPVFQAYRLQVRGEQGVTSADTLQNFTAVLEKAIAAQTKVKAGFGGAEYRVNSFWERASLKSSVDILAQGVGVNVPFQMGATLTPIVTAFVPRILYPEKESIAVGQVFNRTFHISAVEDTYISPSHVGEMYWNFGWPGAVLGMGLIGALLGFIGTRCTAIPALSLTRLMIMLVTIYAFVIRAEGSIATEVVVWMRSVAAIGILHALFARVAGEAPAAHALPDRRQKTLPFPNLIR
jgi:hypothetical protein